MAENKVELTEEQLDAIAEKAAEKAIAKITNEVYASVGKTVVQRAVWVVGAVFLALWLWLREKGISL